MLDLCRPAPRSATKKRAKNDQTTSIVIDGNGEVSFEDTVVEAQVASVKREQPFEETPKKRRSIYLTSGNVIGDCITIDGDPSDPSQQTNLKSQPSGQFRRGKGISETKQASDSLSTPPGGSTSNCKPLRPKNPAYAASQSLCPACLKRTEGSPNSIDSLKPSESVTDIDTEGDAEIGIPLDVLRSLLLDYRSKVLRYHARLVLHEKQVRDIIERELTLTKTPTKIPKFLELMNRRCPTPNSKTDNFYDEGSLLSGSKGDSEAKNGLDPDAVFSFMGSGDVTLDDRLTNFMQEYLITDHNNRSKSEYDADLDEQCFTKLKKIVLDRLDEISLSRRSHVDPRVRGDSIVAQVMAVLSDFRNPTVQQGVTGLVRNEPSNSSVPDSPILANGLDQIAAQSTNGSLDLPSEFEEQLNEGEDESSKDYIVSSDGSEKKGSAPTDGPITISCPDFTTASSTNDMEVAGQCSTLDLQEAATDAPVDSSNNEPSSAPSVSADDIDLENDDWDVWELLEGL